MSKYIAVIWSSVLYTFMCVRMWAFAAVAIFSILFLFVHVQRVFIDVQRAAVTAAAAFVSSQKAGKKGGKKRREKKGGKKKAGKKKVFFFGGKKSFKKYLFVRCIRRGNRPPSSRWCWARGDRWPDTRGKRCCPRGPWPRPSCSGPRYSVALYTSQSKTCFFFVISMHFIEFLMNSWIHELSKLVISWLHREIQSIQMFRFKRSTFVNILLLKVKISCFKVKTGQIFV